MRRAADRIGRVLRGRRAEAVHFAFEHLRAQAAVLAGRVVSDVATRGKAVLVHFEHGWTIYTHNQLYGKWYIRKDPRARPATGRQLRLAIETARGAALLYSASDIELWPTERLHEQAFLARLGPDLLSEAVDPTTVRARLEARRFSHRQLAGLLLDQGFLAGIGNYLRADMLFAARVHPTARAVDLTDQERRRLADAIVTIIERAYRTAGITNEAGRVERLKREGLRRSAFRHLVYGRAGEPCWDCGTPVSVAALGGRKHYWCARCQTAGER